MATVVDLEGRFSVGGLPAGDWLLLATYSVKIDKHSAGHASKQRGVYVPGTHLTGYQRVTVWLREVTITGGGSPKVGLTERGGSVAGGIQERATGAGRHGRGPPQAAHSLTCSRLAGRRSCAPL